jgi:PST family polysaccharide transporter
MENIIHKFFDLKVRISNSQTAKRLVKNFLSLSLLQIANYILPLVTLPYLVRILGPEKFGLISFAQAFIGYFIILTDYGFNLSTTREISICREDINKVSEIFSSVMFIKFVLTLVSLLIMSIVVFSFKKFSRDWLVYYLTFGMVIGQVLFPVWFFQGMERMSYITVLNIIAKLIFTIAIFIFVRKVSDYLYVPLLNSLGLLIAGLIGLWVVFKDFKTKLIFPTPQNIKYHLQEGWHIFISTVAISLYTTSNTFILGLFTSDTIVGYYSAAERIIRAVQGLLTPISQSVYPYISKLANESKEKAIIFIKKLAFTIGFIGLVLSLLLLVFSPLIVRLFLGQQYTRSVVVLRILSVLPFVVALSNVFGVQTMLPLGYKRAFSVIIIAASLINVILSFVLVPLFYEIGTSFAVVISEAIVTVSMLLYLKSKGINFCLGRDASHV